MMNFLACLSSTPVGSTLLSLLLFYEEKHRIVVVVVAVVAPKLIPTIRVSVIEFRKLEQ